MPELPDITIYIEALQRRIVGRTLNQIVIKSPFLIRTVEPDVFIAEGKTVHGLRRIGKRIVFEFDDDLFFIFHLMIAGRFHWRKAEAKPRGRIDLASFGFDDGTLLLTEASQKKRASLHVVRGAAALAVHDPGGLEVLEASRDQFREALMRENHTLKRTLSDPRLFSGIGNAYSDEILHAAGLSPLLWTSRLDDDQMNRLYDATQFTLRKWIDLLRRQVGDGFPEKVTAFHPEMAAHGKYGQPCPICGTNVQRIRYADNETNYCPRCQTEGKLLADRALSRLLKGDWPKTIDELEDAGP